MTKCGSTLATLCLTICTLACSSATGNPTDVDCDDGTCDADPETLCTAQILLQDGGELRPSGADLIQRWDSGRLLEWKNFGQTSTYEYDESGRRVARHVQGFDEGTYLYLYREDGALERIEGPTSVAFSDEPSLAGAGLARLVIDHDYTGDGTFSAQHTLEFDGNRLIRQEHTAIPLEEIYEYDSQGRVVALERHFMASSRLENMVYNEHGRLQRIVATDETGSPLTTTHYLYEPFDDVSGVLVTRIVVDPDQIPAESTQFALDESGRMLSWHWDWDGDGVYEAGRDYGDCYKATQSEIIEAMGFVSPQGAALYSIDLD